MFTACREHRIRTLESGRKKNIRSEGRDEVIEKRRKTIYFLLLLVFNMEWN